MAVDMFLKIEGIDGESSDDKHKGWIEVHSFSWGVQHPVSGTASSTGNLSGGRADFSELSIVKQLDKASPKLMQACASGEHLKTVTLSLNRASGDKEQFMEYKLTDVLVSSYAGSGAGGGSEIPMETIHFHYGKVETKYVQTKVEGGKGAGSVAAGWDLKANKKI